MAIVYNLGSVIVPTFVDVLFVSISLYLTIGLMAALILVVSVILFLFTTWALNKEETSLFGQVVADNSVYREMGQIVGFSKLIVEFACLDFFRKRLDKRISWSLVQHGKLFKIESIRTLLRTSTAASSYALVVIYLYFSAKSG